MSLQLSKTVLGMCIRPLDHILWIYKDWAILAKITFFAIFEPFWGFTSNFQIYLKIDLEVADTFWARIWKAEIVYFPFLKKLSEFGPFCNPNGIPQVYHAKTPLPWNIPFWFQKGIKNWNFVDANFIFEKYGPSAFQNRSDHPRITFRSKSMTFWSSPKSAKNRAGGWEKKSSQLLNTWRPSG